MNSSGIKRGLAFSAVSALAVVGLPLVANANTVTAQFGPGADRSVVLYSQSTGVATTKVDGAIRLEAGASSDINSIRFQYSTDGGSTWVTIAEVVNRNDNGAFATDWRPASNSPLLGTTVRLRAIGQSNLDNNPYTSARNVALQGASGAANAVDLADGLELGVYRSTITGRHSVIASGSASAGTTAISVVRGDGTAYATENTGATAFAKVLDISGGYTYDAPDEIVLRASNGSDDVESYSLYQQALTTVSPVAVNPLSINPGDVTNVDVTVLDQKSRPIAGAIVVQVKGGVLVSTIETNGAGVATFSQAVNDGDVTYIAKATGVNASFQAEVGDKKNTLKLGLAKPTSFTAASVDGPAFDLDENGTGDLSVQVKDQAARDYPVPASQNFTYEWEVTPFNGRRPITTSPQGASQIGTGKYNVELPSLSSADASGVYKLYASLSEGGTGNPIARTLVGTYQVGQAEVVYLDAPDHTIAPVGTVAEVRAKLQLEDGTTLPGRKISVSYSRGTEYDSIGNGPGGGLTYEADAQLISDTPATTDASGAFTARVRDTAESATRTELGGRVFSSSATTPGIGDWVGDEDAARQIVDFVTDTAPAASTLSISYDDEQTGPAGSVEAASIRLVDQYGVPLRGVKVNLSLDHGFFVKGSAPFAAPASGNYVETPNSLGSSVTVITDSNGNARAFTSIGRDAGFDDDAQVTAKLSGSASGNTGSDTVDWIANDPSNVSEIRLVRTPNQGAVTPASTERGVLYDLYAKDQFGNPVKGVDVSIGCAVVLGDDDDCPTGAYTTESDFDNGGDITLYADGDGTFTFTAKVVSVDTQKYGAGLVAASVPVTASATQAFYAPVATSFRIAGPASPVIPGSAATVTVTVLDQQGAPVEDLDVEFVRTGDANKNAVTNEDGVARYTFNRATAGVETVTATVSRNGKVLGSTLETSVTFGAGQAAAPVAQAITPVAITPALVVTSKGKRDIVRVDAPAAAAGAGVRLVKAGRTVASGVLNADGNATLQVKDKNGSKKTSYKVVVDATAGTLKATRIVRVK